MFDIGWGELLLIGIVALIAIGPKELPGVLRSLGQWTGKLRRMASEFQNQFQEAMREAEMVDLKKQVDEMTSQAQSYANFDPVGEVKRQFESTQQQIESAITAEPPVDGASPPPNANASPPIPETAPAADPHALPPASPASEPATVDAGPEAGKSDAGGKPA
jgi:sec-independent protein translocase protein TatB